MVEKYNVSLIYENNRYLSLRFFSVKVKEIYCHKD